jgi:hypothetical protein
MKLEPGLVRDQLSVYYPLHDASDYLAPDQTYPRSTSLFTEMIVRDVSNHIMPIGGRGHTRKDFSIELDPPSKEFSELLATALDGHGPHSYWELAREICDFVSTCSVGILNQGFSVYEIVFFRGPKTPEKKYFRFIDVDSRTLFRRHRGIYQYRSAKAVMKKERKDGIFLPAERLAYFQLPSKYKNLIGKKKAISELGGMDVYRMADEQQKTKGSIYSFKEHNRSQRLALASVMRETGWNMGAGFDGTFLNYYEVWRTLLFNRSISVRKLLEP